MKVELITVRNGEERAVEYEYKPREEGERPMALDVLLQAQATEIPDLAFRYGCRNRTCGICTIDVNGRPRVGWRPLAVLRVPFGHSRTGESAPLVREPLSYRRADLQTDPPAVAGASGAAKALVASDPDVRPIRGPNQFSQHRGRLRVGQEAAVDDVVQIVVGGQLREGLVEPVVDGSGRGSDDPGATLEAKRELLEDPLGNARDRTARPGRGRLEGHDSDP